MQRRLLELEGASRRAEEAEKRLAQLTEERKAQSLQIRELEAKCQAVSINEAITRSSSRRQRNTPRASLSSPPTSPLSKKVGLLPRFPTEMHFYQSLVSPVDEAPSSTSVTPASSAVGLDLLISPATDGSIPAGSDSTAKEGVSSPVVPRAVRSYGSFHLDITLC